MFGTRSTDNTEAQPIATVVTLREAGRRLGKKGPDFVKGAASVVGIKLQPVGTALTMSEEEFLRLKEALTRRKPELAATS